MLDSVLGMEITLPALLLCSLVSLVLGVAAALIYMYKNTYSRSFAVTLALLPIMVQAVIMLVNGNLGTGVAVMGAFSLVRFRSVPGSAREIGAIFLAMALGLATGMGYLLIAAILLSLVGITTLLLVSIRFGAPRRTEKELKITIPESLDYEGLFDDLFKEYAVGAELVRVKTTNMGSLYELCYHISLSGSAIPKAFLDALRCRNGNLNILCGRVSTAKEEL